MAEGYGVHDVQRLLRLPRSTIRSLVHAGFVTPSRGARGAWRFSFQDLIVLRTAQALVDANVPARRITRSMRELKKRLPDAMPLSGLAIGAVADRVVVREGGARWQAESGQYVLEFEADPANGAPRVIERRAAARRTHPGSRKRRRSKLRTPTGRSTPTSRRSRPIRRFVDARINLGRLLHDRGDLAGAERVYRAPRRSAATIRCCCSISACCSTTSIGAEAVEAYEAALASDPDLADAHYNVGLLYEALGRPKDAIRHMARYRVLRR